MSNIKEAARAKICRGSASICNQSGRLFFDIYDDIAQPIAIRRGAGRLRLDLDLPKSIASVKILLAGVDIRRPQKVVRPQSYRPKYRLRLCCFIAGNEDTVNDDFLALIFYLKFELYQFLLFDRIVNPFDDRRRYAGI